MKKWLSLASLLLRKKFKNPLIRINLILAVIILLLFPSQNNRLNDSIIPLEKPLRTTAVAFPTVQKIVASHHKPLPYLTAGGVYLIETNTQSLLYQKNADSRFYPASTTKIVSAMVAQEQWSLKDIIRVKPVMNIGQVLGIKTGEQYYVEDLLYGLLVQSGNDVAMNLAENFPGGYSAFISQMNAMASGLSLTETHFVNPTGIDDWQHYTSPHDMTIISQKAISDPVLARIVATKNYDLKDINGEHEKKMENVNQLLGKIEGIKGIKTGWTELAGECLVSLVERGEMQIIGVVLQSQDRFNDTQNLIAWSFDNFFIEKPSQIMPE